MSITVRLSDQIQRFISRSGIDIDQMEAELGASPQPAILARTFLDRARDTLDQGYLDGSDARELTEIRAWFVDSVLAALWHTFDFDNDLALIAVGGYGRGELQPYSDIDLLILSRDTLSPQHSDSLTAFVTLLWDLKLDIGHSVRTIAECVAAAKEDLSIATNLLETRTISGSEELRNVITEIAYSDQVYTSEAYFLAKRLEQQQRHEKYGGTEYILEPNLKSSPGTLRDIQTIAWITKRHFGPDASNTRSRYQFLSDDEYSMLLSGESFLISLRYGLQMIAERNENRLLFDHQRKLAGVLGYIDSDEKLSVEQMMQNYYRVVWGLAELTDVILQYFDDYYLNPGKESIIKPLNKRFQLNNGYIEVTDSQVFDRSPYALIEIFTFKAIDPSIKGIKATTIRLMREYKYLIDDSFRNDLANTTLFMELLRTPHALHRTLNAMLKYNVLGRYLPEFQSIVGQMQHDLFHIYTVDAHTLTLIKNLITLDKPNQQSDFQLASKLIQTIPKRELLYTAAIYHDIAKGRGGEHSELGAIDAIAFCERHHFSGRDTKLVSWLVENHLIMSMTAQRKDVADPDIIHDFAQLIPSLTHLEYLYILTVCDIAATNPNLWNSWRASLLQQLFIETRRALRRGAENPIDRNDWINATKQEVRNTLFEQGFSAFRVDQLINNLEEDYFLQDSTAELSWQCSAILNHGESEVPLISIRDTNSRFGDGYSNIMIYLRSEHDLFAATTAVLEQLNLNVLSARVSGSGNKFSLSHFVVTDALNQALANDPSRKEKVYKKLMEELDDPDDYPEIIQRRTPRQLKHFDFPTEVTFSNDMLMQRTIVEVVSPDRPGLLARIGKVLLNLNLSLINARIATLGERVEDVFFITQADGTPISDAKICHTLELAIQRELDETTSDDA